MQLDTGLTLRRLLLALLALTAPLWLSGSTLLDFGPSLARVAPQSAAEIFVEAHLDHEIVVDLAEANGLACSPLSPSGERDLIRCSSAGLLFEPDPRHPPAAGNLHISVDGHLSYRPIVGETEVHIDAGIGYQIKQGGLIKHGRISFQLSPTSVGEALFDKEELGQSLEVSLRLGDGERANEGYRFSLNDSAEIHLEVTGLGGQKGHLLLIESPPQTAPKLLLPQKVFLNQPCSVDLYRGDGYYRIDEAGSVWSEARGAAPNPRDCFVQAGFRLEFSRPGVHQLKAMVVAASERDAERLEQLFEPIHLASEGEQLLQQLFSDVVWGSALIDRIEVLPAAR